KKHSGDPQYPQRHFEGPPTRTQAQHSVAEVHRVRTVCAGRSVIPCPGTFLSDFLPRPGEALKLLVHSPLAFLRRTRAMSTGAPTTAVRMPTSTSPGRAITRPSTSAANTRTGAARTEQIMIQR